MIAMNVKIQSPDYFGKARVFALENFIGYSVINDEENSVEFVCSISNFVRFMELFHCRTTVCGLKIETHLTTV
jgi:hypothetical protein